VKGDSEYSPVSAHLAGARDGVVARVVFVEKPGILRRCEAAERLGSYDRGITGAMSRFLLLRSLLPLAKPPEHLALTSERRELMFLQQELVAAGLHLRNLMARAVDETPGIFTHENPKWCVEFRNPINGEFLTVTYSRPRKPAQEN
jgi:hypothetical protein